ncbi:MAG: 7-cyano-7-deazaguanine synthase [Chloroflexi bacterium]|nr:7-cyano-7-deazaguanine synthase [Chloroflexota bacterium]MDA1226955.1 7-cyano-7-deazaguanine synthase [Chloroflexota bacterium]
MKQFLVGCDGATIPPAPQESAVLLRQSLNHRGPEANLNLGIQSPSSALLASVEHRAADLVRLASYVYAADQSVSRGGEADAHGDSWKRHFILHLPVSDLEFWNREQVKESLAETLNFASDDTWDFHFTEMMAEQSQLHLELDPTSVLGNPDGVYLFSGGLDSLCAVLEAAVQQGKRPLLVSHSPAFNIRNRQHSLARLIRERFREDWSFPLMSVAIHRTGSDARDYSQRTRAFLFASLGAVIADRLAITDVCLADNGVVSLNLPINGQLIGARATRSTHPKFLRLFNRFIQLMFANGPKVSNPLWNRTRPETLKVLQDTGSVALVEETNSCSHGRYQTRMQSHCGVCSQCIDRRFATIAAEMEEYDPPERYRVDIFRQELPSPKDRTMALSYARFASEVEPLDATGLFHRYAELFECIDPSDPDAGTVAASLTGMVKRHASTIIKVIEDQIALARSELARQALPPGCLLRLIAGSYAVVAGSQTDFFRHNADYREVWLGDERFDLTTNQSRVVELLANQHIAGGAALSQAYILETLDIGSQNLAQVFRDSTAWNRLVVRADGRGIYRLNIPFP